MKLLTSWVITGFFILTLTPHTAAAKPSDFPEAYAGLNKSAYHPIVFDTNKSDGFSFEIADQAISIALNNAKSTGTAAGNVSFSQTIPGGSISATKGNNSLFGQMHLNNKHYILTTNQAGIWAVELPASGLSFNDCGFDHSEQHVDQKLNSAALKQNNSKVAGTVIDVLMIYDQAIANRYPGDLLQARVDQYFNVSNQTYANSAIDLAIRQVGLEQVGYNFNDANSNVLEQLQQSLSFGVGGIGLENVPQLRSDTGADLVIFLRTHNIETRGNCGIAYFPFAPTGNDFDTSYGVNIMADGMSSWSVCTDQLMVHEIGHNLGAGHHNASLTQRYIPDAAGFAKLGQYGTAMGSFGTGQADRFLELNYFSNPNVQCGGGPCGIAGQRNNANVINQLMGPVSNYQSSVSNAPLPLDFTVALIDQDGDGVLDRDDEFPFDPSETSDSDGDGVGDNGDAFPNLASEQADFDGDGIGDFSDPDIDGDGIANTADRFPFDATESADSDNDGIGNNTDAFEFESTESKDADGDGTGNNADSDDDNDGVIDLSTDKQDLLVINVGNNRILRFDAQTGLAKGIEVLPGDGLLTFQSDLSYDANFNRLFFSSASSIKTLDLMDPYAEPKLLISPYFNPDALADLNTGFPTAFEVSELSLDSTGSAELYWTRLNGSQVRSFSVSENELSIYAFPFFSEFAEQENIIDIERNGEKYYFQGQVNSVYQSTRDVFESELLGNGNYSWLNDPYALVATDDGLLLHSDQGRNKIVITDANTGSFGGIFADIADLGYSNPTGMDITNDGRLLVAVSDQNAILEFDLSTQEFLGELVNGFGLDQPHKMVLVPQLQDRFHEDADKVIRPNAGNWFNPASSGRGFNIGIFNNRLQVLWFTYDEQGLPIWYTSAGLLEGFTYQAEFLKTQLSDTGEFSFASVGEITLEFDNEREAVVSWQLGADSGTESIIWLQSSGEPETADYTGMWSRADTPGWGVAVSTIGDVSFAIPFIYDAEGEPRWTISDVFTGAAPLVFNMDTVFGTGLCPSCSGTISTTRSPSGSTTLNISGDDGSWSSAIIWADPIPGTWQLDETEIIRISSEPTRPR